MALANSEITKASIPQLARLRDELGLSSCLCVPSWLSALCVAHLPADTDDGCQPGLRGHLVPCHATASGKALLAARAPWRREVLKQQLERHTQRTMTGEYLRKDLELWTASRGFAIEDREFEEDKRAVAAPVRDHTGDAVAALTVVGTVEEVPAENLSSIARVVMAAASELSQALGHEAA